MKVTVLSGFDARFFTQPSPWVHIAITDPGPGFHHPRNRCPRKAAVLRLRFSDVTPADLESNPAFRRFAAGLFDAGQAERIVAFLDGHRNAGVDVMVNCEAGISRSSAVANFVLEYFGSRQAPFAPPHYRPNPHVLQVLREVAARRRSGQPAPAGG